MSRISSCFREYLRYQKVSTIFFMLENWWREYCALEYADKYENPEVHAKWEKDANRSVKKAWNDISDILKMNYKQICEYKGGVLK